MLRHKPDDIKTKAFYAMDHLTRYWPPSEVTANVLNLWVVNNWIIVTNSTKSPLVWSNISFLPDSISACVADHLVLSLSKPTGFICPDEQAVPLLYQQLLAFCNSEPY